VRKVIELFDIFASKLDSMTNLHTKIALATISVLMLTLVGCKKEDKYPSWTLDATSIDLEWGQTKEVEFSSEHIKSFGTPTAPKGWSSHISGNKIIISSPTEGANDAQNSGTVELTAKTTESTTLTRKITVSIRIAEEITRVANSMIVSRPNARYKFNAGYRGGDTSEPITGAVKGSLVWTTDKDAVSNVSLEDGYIYFATGNTNEFHEGNAVIAALDKDGKALWSWHIWVTDYDPAEDPDILGGHRVMNRNLGAFANSNATPEDAARSYGLYYQWGRKDPFVGPAVWNSTAPQTIYSRTGSATTHSYTVSDEKKGTIEYSISEPNTFIAGNKDNGLDWLYDANDRSMWSAGSKTLYDPCPAGWRVAPRDIWESFTATGNASSDPTEFNVAGEYNYGWTFVNGEETVFFPAAGRRSFSPTLANSTDNFTNVVNDGEGVGYPVGFYWSSGPIPTYAAAIGPKGISLSFRRDYIDPAYVADTTNDLAGYAPAGGFPLRCVAE
jgi:hypothetical protein